MLLPAAQMVPSSVIFNDSNASVCPDCLDPVSECTCSWQIMQLDASYSIYTTLNDDMNKATPTSNAKLDGLNCGGIPTRTTPTLTPTTMRTIAADIANMSVPSEDFAAAAASDLHHLVSSSCSIINVPSSSADNLSSDLQDRHTLQNMSNQHLTLQNLNNQQLNINNLQSAHHLNQNNLNQQQREDYNNSFSSSASRQAGFVPPLVLQINSNNTNVPQSLGSTILLNSINNSGSNSIFSGKSSSSASSSNWQGVVVTERPQRQSRRVTKRRFTDDEDCDDDYDSAADDGTDSSDTTSGKTTRKQNTKNKSKTTIKSEFKNTGNTSGRRTKDNKIMSAEEESRRQIRRERNKLAAARCRKRRMDHTNELLGETEQLEDKRMRLEVEIQGLRKQKNNLQQMLAQHKCVVNMNNGSVPNSVTSVVNQTTRILDSNDIHESNTSVLTNDLSTTKSNSLHQQNISAIENGNSDSNNATSIIKCEDISAEDNKDNIPITVLEQPQRRRPTTLLQLNNGNFGNNKKGSGNGSTGVVVLNFESLMDGGTGLTPVSTSVGNVQNHHQQVQRGNTGSGVITGNNSVLS